MAPWLPSGPVPQGTLHSQAWLPAAPVWMVKVVQAWGAIGTFTPKSEKVRVWLTPAFGSSCADF